jgi:hypothetical protein
VGFQCQYEGTMYGINEMLETLRTVADPRRHELVIYVYDRQPRAGKSQVHMVRSVTRYS